MALCWMADGFSNLHRDRERERREGGREGGRERSR